MLPVPSLASWEPLLLWYLLVSQHPPEPSRTDSINFAIAYLGYALPLLIQAYDLMLAKSCLSLRLSEISSPSLQASVRRMARPRVELVSPLWV